jgi:type I restriction enzyme R subunit
VLMYDKVKKYWGLHLALLQGENPENHSAEEWQEIQARITYMLETDMAVVVSQGQNEIEDMKASQDDIWSGQVKALKAVRAELGV